MDRTQRSIAAAAGFCLVFALILFITAAAVYNIAGDRSFIAAEMRRHSTPKVSKLPDEQYPEMGRMIAEYLTGRRITFQYYFTDDDGNMVVCFQPHEANHMADCRELIRKTGILRWFFAGAALLLMITGVALRKYRKSYSTGMLAGFGAAVLACLVVIGWGIMNFDHLFTTFHRLFFTNEGWLLDARTDMLIRLMPTSFFVSIGVKLLLAAGTVTLLAFTSAMILRMTGGKEEQQEEQDAGEAAQRADE